MTKCTIRSYHFQGILPDTSHAMVVSEEVNLAYARHLFFDCGNANAAFYYCKKRVTDD